MLHVIKHWILMYVDDEEGLGTLEILLIIAVLVGIAILFRTHIMQWIGSLLNRTGQQIDSF